MNELYDGMSKERALKRSQKVCPTCRKPAVDKAMRKCTACNRTLLWANIDDATYAIKRKDGIYFWYKSIYSGIEGWNSQDFFNISYAVKH